MESDVGEKETVREVRSRPRISSGTLSVTDCYRIDIVKAKRKEAKS